LSSTDPRYNYAMALRVTATVAEGSHPDAGSDGGGGGRIELVSLTKSFGSLMVLKAIDLVIESGEFFSLLGPSGCGKTTTLRLIGGFEENESGKVLIDGVDIGGTPPEKRPVNTVFQSYALFPHLSVADNVGFGLRFHDVARSERAARVTEALELVQLADYADRKPHQLSGGQQQRVALARALILRPRVLLLDEPLGALDAKLRRALQLELKQLHREVGITFVYVTHDQEEALTMSDRLAVMREGQIEQVGTPRQVYDEPASSYVADFLGLANLLPAEVIESGVVEVAGRHLAADTTGHSGDCNVFVRPERLRIVDLDGDADDVDADDVGGSGMLIGTVADVVFVGSLSHIHVLVGDERIQAVMANDGTRRPPEVGSRVGIAVAPDAVRLLDS